MPVSALAQWTVDTAGGDYTIEHNNSGRIPFRIDPGANTNAMFLDTDGDTALGTAAPTNDFNSRLHIADLSPDIAFEDTSDREIWSLYANSDGFGVCDETTYPQPSPPVNPPYLALRSLFRVAPRLHHWVLHLMAMWVWVLWLCRKRICMCLEQRTQNYGSKYRRESDARQGNVRIEREREWEGSFCYHWEW